jgi:hydroxyacylglutathione hydrolase
MNFDGWHLIGQFDSDVGSWLLVNGGDAMLLEVPEGLTVRHVRQVLKDTGAALRFITASHDHEDHIDAATWAELLITFPDARPIHPANVCGYGRLDLDGEPILLVKAPKHSLTDMVVIFRGVAMTGDIELGTLQSVTDEVTETTRRKSMKRLRDFPQRAGYHIHSIVSAHLNDIRTSVNWPELFSI